MYFASFSLYTLSKLFHMYSGRYSGLSVLVDDAMVISILDPHFSQYLMFGLAIAPQLPHRLTALSSLDIEES